MAVTALGSRGVLLATTALLAVTQIRRYARDFYSTCASKCVMYNLILMRRRSRSFA
jgi:hypothetical protein